MSTESAPETKMTVVDGREALAYVIVKPAENGGVEVDAGANGITEAQAAFILRKVADQWDPR